VGLLPAFRLRVSLTPSVPHPVPVFLDPHFLGLYGAAPTHGSRGQEEGRAKEPQRRAPRFRGEALAGRRQAARQPRRRRRR